MSEKSFTVTEGRLRAMAKECPEVEKALKKGFPEAFEEKWKEITEDINTSIFKSKGKPGYYQLEFYEIDGNVIAISDIQASWNRYLNILITDKLKYKIEWNDGCFRVFKKEKK